MSRNAERSGRMGECLAVFDEHDAVRIAGTVRSGSDRTRPLLTERVDEELLGDVALERGELELGAAFVVDHEMDGAIAEVTGPVEEHDVQLQGLPVGLRNVPATFT